MTETVIANQINNWKKCNTKSVKIWMDRIWLELWWENEFDFGKNGFKRIAGKLPISWCVLKHILTEMIDSNGVWRIQCVGRLRPEFYPYRHGWMTIMHITWAQFGLNDTAGYQWMLFVCHHFVMANGNYNKSMNEWMNNLYLTKCLCDNPNKQANDMTWHDSRNENRKNISLTPKNSPPHIDTNDDGDENDWFIIGIFRCISHPLNDHNLVAFRDKIWIFHLYSHMISVLGYCIRIMATQTEHERRGSRCIAYIYHYLLSNH